MEIVRKNWWLILILWATAGLIVYRVMGLMPVMPSIVYWLIVALFLALMGGLTFGVLMYAHGKQLVHQHQRQVAEAHLASTTQVVGKSCQTCGGKIVMANQANRCPNCRQVFCLSCAPEVPCRSCLAQRNRR